MQMGRDDSTPMAPDDRPMMIGVCQREGAEEREPRGYAIVVSFMILLFVLSAQTTNGPSI
jgi:hypothetical protein